MGERWRRDVRTVLITAAVILTLAGGWSFLKQGSSPAFGGNFSPQMAPPGDRYQIAGCDANSAWVLDASSGDVYLIYANGKWKEVGSIQDEKKRIRR